MPLTSHTNDSRQLTVVTGKGDISFDDVRNTIVGFYEGSYTLYVLWDLRNATAREISTTQVSQIATLIQQFGGVQKGIRTAIVAPLDVTFGLSRMLIAMVEAKEADMPVGMGVFRSFEEAMDWLFEEK